MSGVLIPASRFLSVKAVSADTAELLESLITPAPLPDEARRKLAKSGRTLARMVLDSILEVKTSDGFISGPSITKYLEFDKPHGTASTRHASLSIEALQYAQELDCNHAPTLSARMYFYNRIPASSRWRYRIDSNTDFTRFIGIETGTETRRILDDKWIARPSSENRGWLSWRFHNLSWHFHDHAHKHSIYKLYLSPVCEDLQDTLRIALPIMTELEIPSFKLGADLHGILRPDKLMVYLPTFEKLKTIVAMLIPELQQVHAHGIPFTAGIDSEGLLSWGIDPPRSHRLSSWQGTSWRRWITDQLSVALLAAKNRPTDQTQTPWEFALQRLAIEGVDIETWTPINIDWM